MGFMKPETPGAVPTTGIDQANSVMRPTTPAPTTPQAKKRKSQSASFLGQDAAPSMAQQGGKTLLGQ